MFFLNEHTGDSTEPHGGYPAQDATIRVPTSRNLVKRRPTYMRNSRSMGNLDGPLINQIGRRSKLIEMVIQPRTTPRDNGWHEVQAPRVPPSEQPQIRTCFPSAWPMAHASPASRMKLEKRARLPNRGSMSVQAADQPCMQTMANGVLAGFATSAQPRASSTQR
eukprot:NODE_19286_length_850_cov_6.829876.p1 GENE.NODE_19286_length_850_cov_6.829876~~NODE_19286_length_850_cov_6.829876.p1  ORF type:complete len:164 (-),score=8.71 NODE_19286_length_850_cov_6.829876:153-644(-)